MKAAKKLHEQKRYLCAYLRHAMKGTVIKAGATGSGKSTCRVPLERARALPVVVCAMAGATNILRPLTGNPPHGESVNIPIGIR